eukprot:8664251-Prorocentrum_lima.AAC.1
MGVASASERSVDALCCPRCDGAFEPVVELVDEPSRPGCDYCLQKNIITSDAMFCDQCGRFACD